MNVFTDTQIKRLASLDVSGQGGKDAQIAAALGHNRVSARYFDAVTEDGESIEYKKQSSTQWFDLIKLAELSDKQGNIEILWFMHKKGVIHTVHSCTYAELIEALGLSRLQLRVVRLFSRVCGNLKPQVKIPLKKKFISTLPIIWEA